jgi:hypothetical protein
VWGRRREDRVPGQPGTDTGGSSARADVDGIEVPQADGHTSFRLVKPPVPGAYDSEVSPRSATTAIADETSAGECASFTTPGANGTERSNPATAPAYLPSPGSSTDDTPARLSAIAVFILYSSLSYLTTGDR